MNRRAFITRTSTAALAASLAPSFSQLSAATATPAPTAGATYPFAVSPLAYDAAALEPHIDAATMKLHHGKHHAAYVTNLNAALKDHPTLHGLTVGATAPPTRLAPVRDPDRRSATTAAATSITNFSGRSCAPSAPRAPAASRRNSPPPSPPTSVPSKNSRPSSTPRP